MVLELSSRWNAYMSVWTAVEHSTSSDMLEGAFCA